MLFRFQKEKKQRGAPRCAASRAAHAVHQAQREVGHWMWTPLHSAYTDIQLHKEKHRHKEREETERKRDRKRERKSNRKKREAREKKGREIRYNNKAHKCQSYLEGGSVCVAAGQHEVGLIFV